MTVIVIGNILLVMWMIVNFLSATVRLENISAVRYKTISSLLLMDYFRLSDYDEDGRIVSCIYGDKLKVERRKFFIFSINPLNELQLENVGIDAYMYEEANVDLFHFKRKLSPRTDESEEKIVAIGDPKLLIANLGIIVKAVAEKLTLKIFKKNQIVILVNARKATLDLEKEEIRMIDVQVTNVAANMKLISRLVKWKNKEKVFHIPETYILQFDQVKQKGNGLKVDLDFNMFKG